MFTVCSVEKFYTSSQGLMAEASPKIGNRDDYRRVGQTEQRLAVRVEIIALVAVIRPKGFLCI